MFGLFAPKCPLELNQKVWTEFRMHWLADQLGIERMLKADVVIPTVDQFPRLPDKSVVVVEGLMRLLESYVGITEPVPFKLLPEREISNRPPEDDFQGILISEESLDNPPILATKLLRELAIDELNRRGLNEECPHDLEQVAELMLIFVGAGLIAVNNTVVEKSQQVGEWHHWHMSRHSNLTAMDFGYALALFAYVRNEEAPAWITHLRDDAGETMRKGLRFLQKTGDSLFRPDTASRPLRPPTVTDACDRLNSGTPTQQVFALWQLERNPLMEPAVLEAVEAKLADRNWVIGSSAADALRSAKRPGQNTIRSLLKALNSHHPLVRAAAANALGEIGAEPELVIPALTGILFDSNMKVLASAAFALGKFGSFARESASTLIRAIDDVFYRNPTDSNIVYMVAALLRINPDVQSKIDQHFENGNDEHREHLLEIMTQIREASSEA